MIFRQAYFLHKEDVTRHNTPEAFVRFLGDLCTNCGKIRKHHVARKCLFSNTSFRIGRRAGARYMSWLKAWQERIGVNTKYSTSGINEPFWDEEM